MITPTPAQKAELIEACERHAAQDMLIRRSYGKMSLTGFRGCSVGCLAYEINPKAKKFDLHSVVAEHYGLPKWLVHLQDFLFENATKDIHVKLANAIKPRDNWKSVMHAINCRILDEVTLPNAGSSKEVVEKVRDLHKNEETDPSAWLAVESAIDSASAVDSAEAAAVRSAAYSVSEQAALAAEEAVHSAVLAAHSAAAVYSAAKEAEEAALLAIMNIVLEEVAKQPRQQTEIPIEAKYKK